MITGRRSSAASVGAGALALFSRMPRSGDLALAAVVLASVGTMLVRVPPFALDVLIAVNLAAAIALLLIALYVDQASRLTALPSLLLLATLFRLAINVSTTRLVLLDGAAGEVVEAFGNVIVGGNVVVGAVVFLVLTLVQFIVIAKGAERVAEVAARFTLDALPGKQMSIDADLRAGAATMEEAQRRRQELERESQLYGALDGAMKFVKGDAIAGLVITAINIVGGLSVGVFQRGMGVAEAAAHYTVLTIGDGLVSQIPALLMSTTAGLIVTRVPGGSEASNLARDIGAQALAQPRALGIAAVMLAAIALLPGLPALPFAALAAVVGSAAAYRMRRSEQVRPSPTGTASSDLRFLTLAHATPVFVTIGPGILEGLESGMVEAETDALRKRLYAAFGLRVPEIVVRPEPGAPARSFAVSIAGIVARGDVLPGGSGWIAATGAELAPIGVVGVSARAPNGGERVWSGEREVARAAEAGYRTGGPVDALFENLEAALRAHADEFVGVQEARELIDGLEGTHPALVQEVVPRLISLAQLAEVLRRLVREEVSIRDLRSILEALSTAAAYDKEPMSLAEAVRAHLRRQLTEQATGGSGTLPVYLLAADAETAFRDAAAVGRGYDFVPLDPRVAAAVLDSLRELDSAPRTPGAIRPAIVVSREIRRAVRAITETELPHVRVFAYHELLPSVALHPVGTLGAAVAVGGRR